MAGIFKYGHSKSDQTRMRIIDAYITIMRKKGWDKISVKEICLEADITRSTFYQYFSDVYDMLEQLQIFLLDQLLSGYAQSAKHLRKYRVGEDFETNFDMNAPEIIVFWFEFCRENKNAMKSLMGPYGEPTFMLKLRQILRRYITEMMDFDSMPADTLRTHFINALVELHIISVHNWLDEKSMDNVSGDDIVTILNTMRVGGNYLRHLERKMKPGEYNSEND